MSFFFERLPALRPVVPLPPLFPHHPRLTIWGDIFLCQGRRGGIQRGYDDDFYLWWERKAPALEQFPYAGLEFRGDH